MACPATIGPTLLTKLGEVELGVSADPEGATERILKVGPMEECLGCCVESLAWLIEDCLLGWEAS